VLWELDTASATRARACCWLEGYSGSICPTFDFRARDPSVFSDHPLQWFLVQTQISHQLTQPRLLLTQLPSIRRLAHVNPRALGFPRAHRLLRYSSLSHRIFCLPLLESSDQLCFGVPVFGDASPPFPNPKSCLALCGFRDQIKRTRNFSIV